MRKLYVGLTITPGTATTVFWKAHTLVLGVQPSGGITLASHLKLGPKLRMCVEIYPHSPIRLHGMVLNWAQRFNFTAGYWSTANKVSHELNEESTNQSNRFLVDRSIVTKLVIKFHNVWNLNFTARPTKVHHWPFSSTKLYVSSLQHYLINIINPSGTKGQLHSSHNLMLRKI